MLITPCNDSGTTILTENLLSITVHASRNFQLSTEADGYRGSPRQSSPALQSSPTFIITRYLLQLPVLLLPSRTQLSI